MIAYKGFDQNLKCKGHQYKEGQEHTHDGEVKACKSGFHACVNPLDVLAYYPAANGSRYFSVDCDGEINSHHVDSKIACSSIKLSAEIGLMGLIKAGAEMVFDRVKDTQFDQYTSGHRSTAATSGDRSTAATSGDWSTAATSGHRSTAATSGDRSTAATSGNRSTAATSGDRSTAATSGDQSTATTSGDLSTAATSGAWSTAATSGDQSTAATSGDWSTATTSGDWSTAATSGDRSTAATSGDQSTATTSGDWSTATTSGHRSTAEAKGVESIAIATGPQGMARGARGCWIACAEWDRDDKGIWHIVDFQSTKVDGDRIKADISYVLKNGEFVEANGNDI